MTRARAPSFRAVTLAELERSSTAARLGIDNRIPTPLRMRARGLGVVVGSILADNPGVRMTSGYRSPALNAAVRAQNAAAGVNQSVVALPGPGHHDTARGADFAPEGGTRDRSHLAALRDRILSGSMGALVTQAIVEDDHVHVGFDGAALDEIGRDLPPENA